MTLPNASAFSPEQISQYLSHIGFPRDLLSSSRDPTFLRTVHIRHIATIPYENFALHYSPHHIVSIDPQDLFNKIISPANRGGYCLELSVLYYHLLLGLGFTVHPSIARIRLRNGPTPHGKFMGYIHLTLIVTLADGTRWSSDVGFGGDGPTEPLPLVSGEARVNIGKQMGRLVQRTFDADFETGYAPDDGEGEVSTIGDPAVGPATASDGTNVVAGLFFEPSLQGKKAWIYQYANPGMEWASYYAFSGEPARWTDLVAMNEWTSQDPSSFQRKVILGVKFILAKGEEELPLIAGKLMLVDNTLKQNMGGKTETLKVCETEAERVGVIKEWFGINLTTEQQEGIRGLHCEIRSK